MTQLLTVTLETLSSILSIELPSTSIQLDPKSNEDRQGHVIFINDWLSKLSDDHLQFVMKLILTFEKDSKQAEKLILEKNHSSSSADWAAWLHYNAPGQFMVHTIHQTMKHGHSEQKRCLVANHFKMLPDIHNLFENEQDVTADVFIQTGTSLSNMDTLNKCQYKMVNNKPCHLQTIIGASYCNDHVHQLDKIGQKIQETLNPQRQITSILVAKQIYYYKADPIQNVPLHSDPAFNGEIQQLIQSASSLEQLLNRLYAQYKAIKIGKSFSDDELMDFGRGHPRNWCHVFKWVFNRLKMLNFDVDQPWGNTTSFWLDYATRPGWINLIYLAEDPVYSALHSSCPSDRPLLKMTRLDSQDVQEAAQYMPEIPVLPTFFNQDYDRALRLDPKNPLDFHVFGSTTGVPLMTGFPNYDAFPESSIVIWINEEMPTLGDGPGTSKDESLRYVTLLG